jgi:hypothetical protein
MSLYKELLVQILHIRHTNDSVLLVHNAGSLASVGGNWKGTWLVTGPLASFEDDCVAQYKISSQSSVGKSWWVGIRWRTLSVTQALPSQQSPSTCIRLFLLVAPFTTVVLHGHNAEFWAGIVQPIEHAETGVTLIGLPCLEPLLWTIIGLVLLKASVLRPVSL